MRSDARTSSRGGPSPYEIAMREFMSPIPRSRYLQYTDDELAAEVKRLFMLKKAEMAPRIALDMRLLRWYDPQWIGDTWQNPLTGKLVQKLRHNNGLATENIPWSSAVSEAAVGLMTGNKPMAYQYDIEPEDPASDADILQADTIKKYLDRWVQDEEYDVGYMDHAANVVMLGRGIKYVTTDPETMETTHEVLWPGHVAGFWQQGNRHYEQVTIERQLTLSEAFDLYGTSKENREAIQNAMRPPSTLGTAQYGAGGRFGSSADRKYASATVLTHWYRLGTGKRGYDPETITSARPTPMVGMCAVLLYDLHGKSERGAYMLYRSDPTNENGVTGYEDIPVHCTPRFKVNDKPPDEAYGILMQIAGLHTQYNEVFSAFRDMLWRTIYARYVAKGFTFRNAPKIIPGSAIYALPRTDQDFKRIEEAVNTVPVDQFLSHLEKLIVVMPGLNNYFLGSAPPSETSGESIVAAINASITRIEPWRTNVQRGEIWTYRQVLSQAEQFHHYTYQGRTITMAQIIEGKRNVYIHWADVTPKDAEKAKRMAMEAVTAGIVSRDTAMDEFSIHSKADERRKIRKERQDIVLSPQVVLQIATARAQLQALQAQTQQAAGGAAGGPAAPGGMSTPPQVVPRFQQGQEIPVVSGGMATPAAFQRGKPAARANAMARTSAAQAAPKGGTGDNRGAGGGAGGRMARAAAPPAPGQQPKPPPITRR
jgi:hypothetical protein